MFLPWFQLLPLDSAQYQSSTMTSQRLNAFNDLIVRWRKKTVGSGCFVIGSLVMKSIKDFTLVLIQWQF
jgi:hypothetical protein